MPGYTEGFTSLDGDLISANIFEQEYTAIESAFDKDTGHKHDGSIANGAYIPVISGPSNLTEVKCDSVGDQILFSTNVASVKTLQLSIIDGALVPAVTNDVDLGSASLKIKDVYVAGTSNLAIIGLNTGVLVSSILDDDTMTADSDTALVTQQSVRAYIDNKVHTLIASPDGYNAVDVDDATNTIIISTDVASVKTSKLTVSGSAVFPTTHLDLDLGINGTKEFASVFANEVNVDTLTLTGISVTNIYDEDTMGSNSDTALATQQSIKAFTENTVAPVISSVADINAGNGTVVRQTVPATAKGVSGDTAGMVAADASFAYFCHTTWTDGVADIWSRVAIAGGF